MFSLQFNQYRARVLGCWLGKAVGGTLGGPVEGKPGPLQLSFYDPVPTEMLPNDDLDLQVVWVESLRRFGLPVERHALARAWREHIALWPDEYGVACHNLARGLSAPLCGLFDNGFTAGMGAAIRTELWACLAPGDPELARALMREDACVDHCGEGVHAAIYLVTLQSAAFAQQEREVLLDLAATSIPADCRVARAIYDTRKWWSESGDWRAVRMQILQTHGDQNFTDVAMNLAFTVLGWLAGENFDEAICIAVNCGADTDCTGATLGALLGLLDPNSISAKWLEPIGHDLVLSPGMVAMHGAKTLDEFSDQVAALALDVMDYYGSSSTLQGAPDLQQTRENMAPPRLKRCAALDVAASFASGKSEDGATESLLSTEPLAVSLIYPAQVALAPGETGEFRLRLLNPNDKTMRGQTQLRAPDGWQVQPRRLEFDLDAGHSQTFDLQIVAPADANELRRAANPLDLRFECDGFHWQQSAGLLATIPWKHWPLADAGMSSDAPHPPQEVEVFESRGQFLPLLEGAFAVRGNFELPFDARARFVVQAPRELRVWVDDELILDNATGKQCPAIHRSRDSMADMDLGRGWHSITVAVGAQNIGKGGAGETLAIVLGDGDSWEWLRGVEWRLG